jgi:hypothetical protein
VRALVAAWVLALAATVLTVTPAEAAAPYIYTVRQGYDLGAVRGAYNARPGKIQDYREVVVWDRECDSHAVYAIANFWWRTRGITTTEKIPDRNGCADGPGVLQGRQFALHIRGFKLCEYVDEKRVTSCSAWRKVYRTRG